MSSCKLCRQGSRCSQLPRRARQVRAAWYGALASSAEAAASSSLGDAPASKAPRMVCVREQPSRAPESTFCCAWTARHRRQCCMPLLMAHGTCHRMLNKAQQTQQRARLAFHQELLLTVWEKACLHRPQGEAKVLGNFAGLQPGSAPSHIQHAVIGPSPPASRSREPLQPRLPLLLADDLVCWHQLRQRDCVVAACSDTVLRSRSLGRDDTRCLHAGPS